MGGQFDFVAVGDLMLDIHVPEPAGPRLHAPIAVCAGGSAANAARAAVRLGATTAVVGRVGNDAAGRLIADELARAGIEAILEVDADAPTGTTAYVGEAVVADRGANAHLDAPLLPTARITLVSGYLSAPADILERAHGLRALDTQGVAEPTPADVLIGPALDLNLREARVVCATYGADGAAAVGNDDRAEAKPTRTLDRAPVGAGDTFAAAFLLALADGGALADALRSGCDAVLFLSEDAPAERQQRDTNGE